MRVLYETSTLGLAYGSDAAMAGVYRVVHNMIAEARRSQRQEARFLAETHPLAEPKTRRALEHFWPGSSQALEKSWHFLVPSSMSMQVDRWTNRFGARSLPARVARKVLHAGAFRRRPSKGCDVYYSFTYPLPEVDRYGARARFLLIFDMIPVKYPEFFGEAADFMREHHAAVVRSVRGRRDWAVCISEATKRDFCEFTGIDPQRVFVTPLAAGPEFYHVQDEARIKTVCTKYGLPEAPYLLSLCTLEPRKNLAHLIRCFAKLLAAHPQTETHLVLAGAKGWNFDDVLREIEGAGPVRSRIHTPGRIENDDLAALYSGAEAFIYPAHYEGFGLPPLEAMQSGTPVITSNTSSLPEVVGTAGLMVSPRDEEALHAAIWSVVSNSELRRQMREAGLERAKQFSWKRTMDLTLEAFEIALSKQQP